MMFYVDLLGYEAVLMDAIVDVANGQNMFRFSLLLILFHRKNPFVIVNINCLPVRREKKMIQKEIEMSKKNPFRFGQNGHRRITEKKEMEGHVLLCLYNHSLSTF